jgi:GR25 family glycosyltransferase involved in LPS biosynthesis
MLANPYIIHLEDCHERDDVKEHLEKNFGGQEIPFYPAIRIDTNISIIWKSPYTGYKPMLAGAVGCLESHIALYKSNQRGILTVFEDDAFVKDQNELNDFINLVPKDFDIILLGYNKIVNANIENGIYNVKRFYGTHAMILTENVRQLFIEEYETQKPFAEPVDWLWSRIIEDNNLKVYAPLIPPIIQKPGLVSQITGVCRQL